MPNSRLQLRIFSGLVVAVLVLLTTRLTQLQLIESDIYTGESKANTVHTRRVQPARGLFFDRNGRLLVDNEPTYSLEVTPRFFDEEKIPLLAALMEVPDSTVTRRLKEARAWSIYRASKLFREVPFEVMAHVKENLYQLPGVNFVVDNKRRYHQNVNASHLYGYIKEISRRRLDELSDNGYRMGDPIGQSGIENTYEPQLRGTHGEKFVLVNIRGQEVKAYRNGIEDTNPISGYDLTLTIDGPLQALAETLMVNKRGAAVAIDPRNGEILAMVSAPDFDPALLAGQIEGKLWTALERDRHKPLFNRATMSHQPPGSTFKPFMALSALQDGTLTEHTPITCGGAYYYGGQAFRCMGAHGTLTVKDAIKRSCNTFFFTTMMRMNFQSWSDWGKRFGFGREMPTDIPEQATGIFPDSAYFNRTFGKGRWTPGYLVSLGIGQGNMGVTPMQLARYCAAVANGGRLLSPHVVRELIHPETGERLFPELPEPEQIPIEPRYFEMVREGMRRMVMENNSTVRWGEMVVAGKTGTAQNPHGNDHAWFMGFAPFEDPQIVVAVLVENGGYGASVSAPIGGLLMEQYLEGTTDKHPPFVKTMAFGRRSEGMEDGSGARWHRLPERRLNQPFGRDQTITMSALPSAPATGGGR